MGTVKAPHVTHSGAFLAFSSHLFASTQNEDPSELQLTDRESQSQGFGASLDVPESSRLTKTLLPGA
jgi:hypothetical protein